MGMIMEADLPPNSEIPPTKFIPSAAQLATNFGNKVSPRTNQTGKRWAKPKPIPPLSQALRLQQALFTLSLKKVNNVKELAQLSNTWATIEDRRQVLAGVGRPKSVEAANSRKHSTKRAVTPAMIDPSNDQDVDPGDSKSAAA
jgi:hypothetical protein